MTDPETNHSVRVLATQALQKVIEDQQSLSQCLPPIQAQCAKKDQALLQELVFGTCRWYFALAQQIDSLLERPLPKRMKHARTLMALGAYQLQFMRIPAHAALHETVEAAEALNLKQLKGLINAILRKISRSEVASITTAHRQSHPQWMQDKLSHNWPTYAEAIFAANNDYPPMTLRVNRQQISRNDYLEQLRASGIEAHACVYAETGIQLESPCPVETLPGFGEGLASVQDEAAQLCTLLLDLQDRQRVLDACAAPGGKTCSILESNASLSVLALDADATRSQRISENLERMKLSCEVKISPAEQLENWWDGKPFERILLDAPCSATGVIRRHPDIKLLRREQDIVQLAALQLKILQELWKTLASGGKLLYATCSVFPQENSRIIERFLKQEASAKLNPIGADWGVDTGFGRQLFPHQKGHDGFFYACLEKL